MEEGSDFVEQNSQKKSPQKHLNMYLLTGDIDQNGRYRLQWEIASKWHRGPGSLLLLLLLLLLIRDAMPWLIRN